MKTKIAFILLLSLCAWMFWRILHSEGSLQVRTVSLRNSDTSSSDALRVNGAVNLKFVGADGRPYYFSLSDTVPGFPFCLPHLLLSQGDPLYLHSVLALDNNSRTGDDSLNAVIGIVDNHGEINNVLRATPRQIGIQSTLAGDSSGGAYYGFSKDGIILKRGDGKTFELMYILSNHKGKPGQILTISEKGDTAIWQNPSSFSAAKKYFAPTNGQKVSMAKSAYNIIDPSSDLLSLTIDLPVSPEDNDWFELTFTKTVKTISYTGGKAANNSIKSATASSCYKKFVFRKENMTWY